MIPPEQVAEIKKQILAQIQHFPEDKKAIATQQINAMNSEQLEQFLIQNKMMAAEEESKNSPPQNPCIFCAISEGQVPSHKIDENKDSIAILEINPISKGHSMVIPKKHLESTDKLPQTSFSLSKKIAKKLKSKFKPKDVLIASTNVMGHEAINVIPIYENENINSQRKKAEETELKELQKLLEKKPRKTKKKRVIKKNKPKKLDPKKEIWLPKRIP